MGSQEPSERIAPEYQRSDGLDAAKLVRVGGTVLDPWQGDVLDDWMGFTPAHLLAGEIGRASCRERV